jgi:PQQ-dependent dehydrogenase (s-GDH family)
MLLNFIRLLLIMFFSKLIPLNLCCNNEFQTTVMRQTLLALLAACAVMGAYAQTPVVNAKKITSTITVNGTLSEPDWDVTLNCSKALVGTPNNIARFGVMWNTQYLYVAYTVTDANLFNDSQNEHEDDGIELYIDADNNGGTSYGTNDRQFMKGWNTTALWEKNNRTTGVLHAWTSIAGGYSVELAVPWSSIGISSPAAGLRIGFDAANNDDDNGSNREHQLMWAGDNDNWRYPRNFGDLLLIDQPDTQAPSAPSNLAISGNTQTSVSLTWTAATDNVAVTGYDVYNNGVKINASLVTATNYTVTGLTFNTAYAFHVVARDAAGNTSGNSNTTNITIPDITAPSAPASLSAANITETSLDLSWNASSDNVGVTGYDVFQNGIKINSSPVTGTTYRVTGLTGSTTYAFYVQAIDAAGNVSANSNTLNATTLDTQAPTAPANLVASAVTQSSLTLSWSASSDNLAVAGYDVYRDGIKINGAPVTGTTYNVTGLSALTSYSFYVNALDAAGNVSVNSNTVDVTTPDTQAPSAPGGLAASAVTAVSLTLTWNASTDNVGVTGYDIYQNNTRINSSPVTETSYNVTGLTNGTAYSFYVRALDNAGNVSGNSNTVNVTTLDTQAPSTPSGLAASAVAATTLTLGWSASTDNVGVAGYDVYQNGTKINSSVVTGLTYGVTGLTASTAYSFFVRALDAAGNVSGNSNTINVTTTAGGCTGTGAINFQRWNNITGTTVPNLTSNGNYPNNPSSSGTLTTFEIPSNSGDNYGMKVYGYICPPATGSYTFWIASDDNSELWLSTNSSAANKQRIAYHTQYTNSRQWNKYTTQKSVAITLTAGQLYYVEALMKEGAQGDNMAVGWAKPGQSTSAPSEVIPGSSLLTQISSGPDTQAPTSPTNLTANNIGATSLTLSWTASTDNILVTGYDVYRDGVKINGSNITGTSYNVTGLTASTTYGFFVRAKDGAGNNSGNSNTVNVTTSEPAPGSETFTQRTVIANQRMPHDLVYGPDNNIWYTERFAGTVNFVNPATGAKTTVLTLGSKMARTGGQDGLMGLALHPQFNSGKAYVYISYTYQSTSATVRKTRIERYTYSGGTLGSPVTMLEDIPGSNDHNSARIAIGPDLKLYYSVGDMGAGQYDNQTRANNAQNLNIYEGKILRLNTETIAGSWIPTDNPFTNGGQKTAVYSYGHRNPQGLVWGNVNGTNILYSSEHGPYSDDELNIIETGRNYGWPNAIGFCDNNYNGRTTGGFTITNEQNNCTSLNVKEPIRSIFPAANPPQEGSSTPTWPSMAPSGTDFYGSTAIPGWQNSLLVAMLKAGTITRYKLSNDGLMVISDSINYFKGKGRFRDVIVSPDGLKIYVACDSSGSTSGPTGGVTSTPANPGSILEFTFVSSGMRATNDLVTEMNVTEDKKDRSIDVYPNPANSFVIVYNYSAGNARTIEMIDMNGRVVRKQSANKLANRVETGSIGNGLYILRVTDEKGKVIRTEKVLVQK